MTDQELLDYGVAYPETSERIDVVLASGDPEERALLEEAIADHQAENAP